jgi:hypothetical protein
MKRNNRLVVGSVPFHGQTNVKTSPYVNVSKAKATIFKVRN